jgi:hypothetical protein
MDKEIEKAINAMYRGILYEKKSKKHRFLIDMESAENIHQKQMKYYNQFYSVKENEMMKGIPDKNINMDSYCKDYYERKEVITSFQIGEIWESVTQSKHETEVFHILEKVIDKKLISTISSIEDIEKRFIEKKENELNVLIIGAGPNGLFLANYINQLYNQNYSNFHVNILVLDNRIASETIRMPYNRNRVFQIGTRYLDIVLPNIYCKTERRNNRMDIPIKYLEFLFYLKTFQEEVPLLFTNQYEKWTDIQKLIKKLNIDVLYDSSGGRIDGIHLKPDSQMIKGIDMKSEKYTFHLDKKKSLVELKIKGNIDTFLSVDFLGKDSFYVEPITFDIRNEDDFELLQKVCIPKKDYLSFIKKIKDKTLQKKCIGLYEKVIKQNSKIEYIILNSFHIRLYHRLKVCEQMKYKNQSFLYIGTGDTIFSSHYLVGAGLNRTIVFSLKTCHLFPMLFTKY